MTLNSPRPLRRDDNPATFDCGDAELDNWLGDRALMAAAAGTTRTFVVTDDEHAVCASYALCPASVHRAELPTPPPGRRPDGADGGEAAGAGPISG